MRAVPPSSPSTTYSIHTTCLLFSFYLPSSVWFLRLRFVSFGFIIPLRSHSGIPFMRKEAFPLEETITCDCPGDVIHLP